MSVDSDYHNFLNHHFLGSEAYIEGGPGVKIKILEGEKEILSPNHQGGVTCRFKYITENPEKEVDFKIYIPPSRLKEFRQRQMDGDDASRRLAKSLAHMVYIGSKVSEKAGLEFQKMVVARDKVTVGDGYLQDRDFSYKRKGNKGDVSGRLKILDRVGARRLPQNSNEDKSEETSESEENTGSEEVSSSRVNDSQIEEGEDRDSENNIVNLIRYDRAHRYYCLAGGSRKYFSEQPRGEEAAKEAAKKEAKKSFRKILSQEFQYGRGASQMKDPLNLRANQRMGIPQRIEWLGKLIEFGYKKTREKLVPFPMVLMEQGVMENENLLEDYEREIRRKVESDEAVIRRYPNIRVICKELERAIKIQKAVVHLYSNKFQDIATFLRDFSHEDRIEVMNEILQSDESRKFMKEVADGDEERFSLFTQGGQVKTVEQFEEEIRQGVFGDFDISQLLQPAELEACEAFIYLFAQEREEDEYITRSLNQGERIDAIELRSPDLQIQKHSNVFKEPVFEVQGFPQISRSRRKNHLQIKKKFMSTNVELLKKMNQKSLGKSLQIFEENPQQILLKIEEELASYRQRFLFVEREIERSQAEIKQEEKDVQEGTFELRALLNEHRQIGEIIAILRSRLPQQGEEFQGLQEIKEQIRIEEKEKYYRSKLQRISHLQAFVRDEAPTLNDEKFVQLTPENKEKYEKSYFNEGKKTYRDLLDECFQQLMFDLNEAPSKGRDESIKRSIDKFEWLERKFIRYPQGKGKCEYIQFVVKGGDRDLKGVQEKLKEVQERLLEGEARERINRCRDAYAYERVYLAMEQDKHCQPLFKVAGFDARSRKELDEIDSALKESDRKGIDHLIRRFQIGKISNLEFFKIARKMVKSGLQETPFSEISDKQINHFLSRRLYLKRMPVRLNMMRKQQIDLGLKANGNFAQINSLTQLFKEKAISYSNLIKRSTEIFSDAELKITFEELFAYFHDVHGLKIPPLPVDIELSYKAMGYLEDIKDMYLGNGELRQRIYNVRDPLYDFSAINDLANLVPQIQRKLNSWGEDLQSLWVYHMPLVDESKIVEEQDPFARNVMAEESFERWVVNKTKIELVSFRDLRMFLDFRNIIVQMGSQGEHILLGKELKKVEQRGSTRLKAFLNEEVKAREQAAVDGAKCTDALRNLEMEKEKGSTLSKELLKAPDEVQRGQTEQFRFKYHRIPPDVAGIQVADSLAILGLRPVKGESPQRYNKDTLENWIREIAKPKVEIEARPIRILEACTELADEVFSQGTHASSGVQRILLDLFRNKDIQENPLDLREMENTNRAKLLTNILKMNLGFYKQREKIYVNSVDYNYLVQLYNNSSRDRELGEIIFKKLVVTDPFGPMLGNEFIDEVAKALQESEIRLEGLEESTVLQSIQENAYPLLGKDQEGRNVVNKFCRSSGNHLLFYNFMKSLKETYGNPPGLNVKKLRDDLGRNLQNREFFTRSFSRAIKGEGTSQEDIQEFRQWLVTAKNTLQENDDMQLYETSMATPLKIFLMDVEIQLVNAKPSIYPPDTHLELEIKTFNQELIDFPDANKKLLGFSREISRLSSKISQRRLVNPDDFASLVQYRIGYEFLMSECFSDRKIVGFLEMEVKAAQEAMSSVASILEELLKDREYIGALREKLVIGPREDPKNYCEQQLQQYHGLFRQNRFGHGRFPGFLNFGDDVEFDIVHGHMYIENSRVAPLPAHLKNHPDVRDLSLHNYPYTKRGNVYVYNVSGQGKIYIADGVDGVSILRRLERQLTGDHPPPPQEEILLYIPQDEILRENLPRSVANRMNVQSFWSDYWLTGQDQIYGVTKSGELQVQLKWDVQKRVYRLSTEENKGFVFPNNYKGPLINCLRNHFSDEEILINPENKECWIPSLDLKIQQDMTCSGRGFDGKCIEIDQGCLVIRNQLSREDVHSLENIGKEIREARRKLQRNKDLLEGGMDRRIPVSSRSLLPIKSKIVQLENKLDSLRLKREKLKGKEQLATTLEQQKSYTEMENQKVLLQQAFRDLRLSFQHKENVPDLYKKALEDFREARESYRKSHETSAEPAFFSLKERGLIGSRDLLGALHLVSTFPEDRDIENMSLDLIKDIGKHPLDRPLEANELFLLNKAMERSLQNQKLYLCLSLLHLQHFQRLNEQISHGKMFLKEEGVEEALKQDIQQRVLQIDVQTMPEIIHLWEMVSSTFEPPAYDLSMMSEKFSAKKIQKVEIPLRDLKESQVLIESFSSQRGPPIKRLGFEKKTTYRPKLLNNEGEGIQQTQREAIDGLQTPEQEKGFYWEEFGLFDPDSLLNEFRISRASPTGLFTLDQNDVSRIFQFLLVNGYIQKEEGFRGYFSICNRGADTLDSFSPERLRTILAPLALKGKNIDAIADRLQKFLFKAACARGDFEIQESEAKIKAKIQEEQRIHKQQFLEAEAVLNHTLRQADLDIADLKCAFLTDNYDLIQTKLESSPFEGDVFREINRLRTTLVRYLFHKTEFQHLKNSKNAPPSGERNQMELMNTRRSYDTNLLLKTLNPLDIEYEEQRIQMAFLLFEEDYGYRCNAMQAKMFRGFLLPRGHPDAIDAAQARMGFGKTALLPIIALALVGRGKLVRYIVPRAVLEDNTSAFNQRIFSILGSNVIKDKDFTRYQVDDENKATSYLAIHADLKERLAFYRNVRDQGRVLIQPPEIRNNMQAQEDSFREKLRSRGLNQEERRLLTLCIRTLGQIRSLASYTVSDELDDVQDIRSRETNYTEGGKRGIEVETIAPIQILIGVVNHSDNMPPFPGNDPDHLEKKMLEAMGIEQNPQLLRYLKNRTLGFETVQEYLSTLGLTEQQMSSIFLIRAFALESGMLMMARDKKPNTHFGVRFVERAGKRHYFEDQESGSKLLIAVPYEGVNTPKGFSIYDNTEIAAITTIRYYLSEHTNFEQDPHLEFLLKQQERGAIHFEDRDIQRQITLLERLDKINRAAEEAKKDLKDQFYKDYMEVPSPWFRKFFGAVVVETQVRSDEGRANSNRYEMGSPEDINKGCSGTTGNQSSYYEVSSDDPAADAKISIEIMGRANNQEVVRLQRREGPGIDYLDETLNALLIGMRPETRALIDTAGICKSKEGTPESIVRELWNRLQVGIFQGEHIRGIIYYDRYNKKRLYTGGPGRGDLCTQEMEEEEIRLAEQENRLPRYFTFYDQKHTRGSDVKQANGVHALVTADENNSNSDVKQAILRLRSLVSRNSGQTFSFAITPEMEKLIRSELNLPSQIIRSVHIAAFLRQRERVSEENDAVSIFRKEMTAHVRQACDHLEHHILGLLGERELQDHQIEAYEDFLDKRNQVCSFIQKSIKNLPAKYGGSVQVFNKGKFIESLIWGIPPDQKGFDDALNEIFGYSIEFAQRLGRTEGEIIKIGEKKHFYIDKAKKSIGIFDRRFTKDGEVISVPIVDVNVVAEDVAEVQVEAEALAEALAEKLAEALAQNEVEKEEWNYDPLIPMTKESHVQAHLKFLPNMNGAHPLSNVPGMRDLVLEKYRGKFFCSPHLCNTGAHHRRGKLLPPIFFLKEVGGAQRVIFISQEEADLFKALGGGGGFTLHDAEILKEQDGDGDVIRGQEGLGLNRKARRNIKAAILRQNIVCFPSGMTTEELRRQVESGELSLPNVRQEPEKYLPKLQVENKDQLDACLNLKGFSLEGEEDPEETSIGVKSTNQSITMNVENVLIEIPRTNDVINGLMESAYRDPPDPLNPYGLGVADKMLIGAQRNRDLWLEKEAELIEKQRLIEEEKINLDVEARRVEGFDIDVRGVTLLSYGGWGNLSNALKIILKLAHTELHHNQQVIESLMREVKKEKLLVNLIGGDKHSRYERLIERAKEFLDKISYGRQLAHIDDSALENELETVIEEFDSYPVQDKTQLIRCSEDDLEKDRLLRSIPNEIEHVLREFTSLQNDPGSDKAQQVLGRLEELDGKLGELRLHAAIKYHGEHFNYQADTWEKLDPKDALEEAKKCTGKTVCGHIERAIAGALKNIDILRNIIVNMQDIERRMIELEEQRVFLEGKIQEATEAYNIMVNVVRQQDEAENILKAKRIHFARDRKLLDMLNFNYLEIHKGQEVEVQSRVKGFFPKFSKTFQDIKDFSDKRYALTNEELINYQRNERIHKKTRKLAGHLVRRDWEIVEMFA